MDLEPTPDRNHPKHPISIHDMDIEEAAPRAAIWWRSERREWPLERALLVWMIYETNPPTIYSADNPADVNAFDQFYDRTLKFSKRLSQARCPDHGTLPAFVHGMRDNIIHFRCSAHPHYYLRTFEDVNNSKEID